MPTSTAPSFHYLHAVVSPTYLVLIRRHATASSSSLQEPPTRPRSDRTALLDANPLVSHCPGRDGHHKVVSWKCRAFGLPAPFFEDPDLALLERHTLHPSSPLQRAPDHGRIDRPLPSCANARPPVLSPSSLVDMNVRPCPHRMPPGQSNAAVPPSKIIDRPILLSHAPHRSGDERFSHPAWLRKAAAAAAAAAAERDDARIPKPKRSWYSMLRAGFR
jgi:hypothetical protein